MQAKIGEKVRYKEANIIGRVSKIGSKRFPESIEIKVRRNWFITLHPGEWEKA